VFITLVGRADHWAQLASATKDCVTRGMSSQYGRQFSKLPSLKALGVACKFFQSLDTGRVLFLLDRLYLNDINTALQK